MKKLLLALIVATGLIFSGCVTQTPKTVDTTSTIVQPKSQYDDLQIFGEGTTVYKVPKYIDSLEPKWLAEPQDLTPSIRVIHLYTQDKLEVFSIIIDTQKRYLLISFYDKRSNTTTESESKFFIYDGEAYPKEVDEETAKHYFETKINQSRGI